MDIEVKNGMFDYESGELALGKETLNLRFCGRELIFPADSLRSAIFVQSKGGGCRVELSSDAEQAELFIPRKEDAEALAASLYALTGDAGRVAMILGNRDR